MDLAANIMLGLCFQPASIACNDTNATSQAAAVPSVEYGLTNCNSGIGFPMNRLRQGRASHRAHRVALLLRALSVAMPVLAYICRYSLEMKMKARRAFREGVQLERFQMELKL